MGVRLCRSEEVLCVQKTGQLTSLGRLAEGAAGLPIIARGQKTPSPKKLRTPWVPEVPRLLQWSLAPPSAQDPTPTSIYSNPNVQVGCWELLSLLNNGELYFVQDHRVTMESWSPWLLFRETITMDTSINWKACWQVTLPPMHL